MFNNKNISLLTKWYVIGLGLILGITSSYAITLSSTETQWSESDFELGSEITQNMLLSQTLGYTCNDTNCSQKIYWKKISTTSEYITDAAAACEAIGMVLPSSDQISFWANTHQREHRTGLDMGVYKTFNTMTNASSYHRGTTRYSTNRSWSTNSYTGNYYNVRRPDSWSSQTQSWGYSALKYFCVYKRWH